MAGSVTKTVSVWLIILLWGWFYVLPPLQPYNLRAIINTFVQVLFNKSSIPVPNFWQGTWHHCAASRLGTFGAVYPAVAELPATLPPCRPEVPQTHCFKPCSLLQLHFLFLLWKISTSFWGVAMCFNVSCYFYIFWSKRKGLTFKLGTDNIILTSALSIYIFISFWYLN